MTLAGTELPLRAKEYELLARLAAQPGVAVSRDTLMADVWDENWFGSTKTLDCMSQRCVASSPRGPTVPWFPKIVTLRGHGYRLDVPSTD